MPNPIDTLENRPDGLIKPGVDSSEHLTGLHKQLAKEVSEVSKNNGGPDVQASHLLPVIVDAPSVNMPSQPVESPPTWKSESGWLAVISAGVVDLIHNLQNNDFWGNLLHGTARDTRSTGFLEKSMARLHGMHPNKDVDLK